ncbi:hypothetical protein [Oceanispirochaeta sp.]|uniref:hypothetical protein n=1 Tax=Oceanispirochaeta sp. TaxID=2035350 RepID=UPI002629CE6D|nr:hypothetical protein [Oceanispirochaeta sp.]MDA3957492.1 hypothetical protein [Oceanispirochaeta sp.]
MIIFIVNNLEKFLIPTNSVGLGDINLWLVNESPNAIKNGTIKNIKISSIAGSAINHPVRAS